MFAWWPSPRRLAQLDVEVHESTIELSSYPYEHSSLYGHRVSIAPSRISCVFNAISEVAFVLDDREVIFLPRDRKESFAAFVRTHRIPDHEVEEVWIILAEPYLDREYTKDDELRDYQRLGRLGVPRDEVERLRKRIGRTMLAATFYTWEWILYSTQDVLRIVAVSNPRRFTRAFYWLVMEVALRPYPLGRRRAKGNEA